MPTKTFQLNLVDGHALIEDEDNIILIDTGSPVTIHQQKTLKFMNHDFTVNEAPPGASIPQLCEYIGTTITTLMGMDKLSYYKIIFDYPNKRITFSNKTDLVFEGESIALTSNMTIPVIDVTLNEHSIPCFFDTGAKLSYLHSSETQNLRNLGELSDFHPGIGRFQSPTFEVETQVGTKVFPVIYGNLPNAFENMLLKIVAGNNGIIGYDFLKKYKIYMDAFAKVFKIAESSPGEKQIPDELENEMPDFMKWDNIMKAKNKL